MDNGKMINRMGKGQKFGLMEQSMKETISKEEKVGKEN